MGYICFFNQKQLSTISLSPLELYKIYTLNKNKMKPQYTYFDIT